MSNIHGLHSNSHDSDEEKETRYVGGAGGSDGRSGGSGLAVLPNDGDAPGGGGAFESMISNARADAESEGGPMPSAAECTRKITMYKSGFTVDDGEYRDLKDPANVPFLTALSSGRVPPEFVPEGGPPAGGINIHLEDKRAEEYVAPAYVAFGGGGNSLAAEGGSTEGLVASAAGDGVVEAPVVDEGQPTAAIQ
ncbi:hypothetical protein TeGR_g6501, partial [Tetraparma gracilis]